MSFYIAHVNIQGRSCLICDADATSRLNTDRDRLLARLVAQARASGLRVDLAALAFSQNGRITFYGERSLTQFLSDNGLPRWTHKLSA